MKNSNLFAKALSVSLILLSLTFLSWAQNPNYDLASRFSKKTIDRVTFSTRVIPYWFKNSDKFWYSYSTSEGTNYYIVDPVKGTKKRLFDNYWMASRLTEIVKDPLDAKNLPIGRLLLEGDSLFVFHVVSSAKEDRIDTLTGKPRVGVKIHGFKFNFEKKILEEIQDYKFPSMYPVWANVAPDKKHAVLSRNHNLYLLTWEDYEKAKINYKDTTIVYNQITFDGTPDFPYGPGCDDIYKKDQVRDVPDRPDIVWSPDSKHFAMVRSDKSSVKDMWVINSLSNPRPTLETYNYHLPGEEEAPDQYLYVYDIEQNRGRSIPIGRFKNQTLTIHQKPISPRSTFDQIKHNIWEGSENSFLLTRVSRDHKKVDLCKVNIDTDSVSVLIEERMNISVNTREPSCFNGNILWWSERDGWGHLYRYDYDGNLMNKITIGNFHVENTVAIDTLNGSLLIQANGVDGDTNPYYSNLYRVKIEGGVLTPIGKSDFENQNYFTDNGSFIVNNYSRVNSVPKSVLLDKEGNELLDLETADLSMLMEMGYKFPEPFKVKAADGKTDLYGVMYKPYDFDSTKTYPIIEYVYPGPHTESVNLSWSSKMDDTDRLAQLGFIVISIGNRGGSPLRSKWYHSYGYKNLRDYGLEDKKFAIEQLSAKHKYIDSKRVGIFGHSGGGFMTAAALLKYPDFFKVGIAISGNHDNNIYNRWWGEVHNGVEEVISSSGDTTFNFSVATNIEIAKNLRGRILLVTGDIDDNVHPANTYRLADAFIKARKKFDIFIFPGQRHNLSGVGEYLFWLKADYFSKYLLTGYHDNIDLFQDSNN